jgi:hypothetical protein
VADLQKNIAELRAGSISAEQFYAEVQANLRGVSRKVARMLRTPTWFTREDLEQEIALSVWLRAWDYDDTRGTSELSYVLWNAKKAGMKAANGARHGGHRPHRNENLPPPCTEIPATDQIEGQEDDEGRRRRQPCTEATQESDLVRREEELTRKQAALARALAACRTPREAAVMAAVVAEGGVAPAAAALWGGGRPPSGMGIRSRTGAQRLVWETLERVASRLLEDEEAA